MHSLGSNVSTRLPFRVVGRQFGEGLKGKRSVFVPSDRLQDEDEFDEFDQLLPEEQEFVSSEEGGATD